MQFWFGMTNPVVSKATSGAAAKSQLPVSNVELGEALERIDSANSAIATAKDKLARIDAGLGQKLTPDQETELEGLKKKYTGELKTATAKRDAAKAAVETAFRETAGATATPAGNGKLYERIESLKNEIGAAKPGDRLDTLVRAKSALEAELLSRENKTFAAAKADRANQPELEYVRDVADFASNTRALQLKVLGAPVVGTTGAQAAELDRARIASEIDGAQKPYDLYKGSLALATQLENSDPKQQEALVRAAAGAKRNDLATLADAAQSVDIVANGMNVSLKATRGKAQELLADAIVAKTTLPTSPVLKSLAAQLMRGEGFEQALALERGFERAGRMDLAAAVKNLRTEQLERITSSVEGAAANANQMKTELARLVAGFGPMVPGEKLPAAIDAFKKRHPHELNRLESASKAMTKAAQFIAEHPNEAGPRTKAALIEALGSDAGQAFLVSSLKAKADGRPSLFDSAPDLMKDSTKAAKYLPVLTAKAVGSGALAMARLGKAEKAKEYLQLLNGTPALFGLKPDAMKDTVKALEGVMNNDEKAMDKVREKLSKMKPDTGGYSALKVLAWGGSIASGVLRMKDDPTVLGKVKGAVDVLTPSAEIAASVLEMVSKAPTDLKLPSMTPHDNAKFVGGTLNMVSSVFDTIKFVQYAGQGQDGLAVSYAASSLGGAVLAFDTMMSASYGVQAVPVWGQLAGAALVVGGMGGKWYFEERRLQKAEDAVEGDAKAFLEAAGVRPDAADKLSDIKRADGRNVGQIAVQIAEAMEMDPQRLWKRLQQMPTRELERFVDMTKELPFGPDGKVPRSSTDPNDRSVIGSRMEGDGFGNSSSVDYYPKSLSSAAEFTRVMLQRLPKKVE